MSVDFFLASDTAKCVIDETSTANTKHNEYFMVLIQLIIHTEESKREACAIELSIIHKLIFQLDSPLELATVISLLFSVFLQHGQGNPMIFRAGAELIH